MLIETGAGQGSGIADEQYAGGRREIVGEAGRDLGAGRHGRQGQGAAAGGVAAAAAGPGRLHLLPLRRRRAADPGGHRERHHGHRLRDDPGPARRPAALDADERGRGADEHPGRGEVPGAAPGRAGGFCSPACRASLPAEVAILGGGVVGANAAKVAAGLGANVFILDINLDRLRYLDDVMPPNVTTLYSDRHNILESIERADLVIGAVLIPGARAPRLVRREDLDRMKTGAVIIDVAIDQGGCVETSRPTTHRQPDLHRGRRGPLLRDQHAGRGRPDQHLRADQRDAALRLAAGHARMASRGRRRPGRCPRGSISTRGA